MSGSRRASARVEGVSDVSRHGRVSALSATYAPPPPTFSVSYSTFVRSFVRSFVHSYCGLADERATWFLSRCPLSLSLCLTSLRVQPCYHRLQTRTAARRSRRFLVQPFRFETECSSCSEWTRIRECTLSTRIFSK